MRLNERQNICIYEEMPPKDDSNEHHKIGFNEEMTKIIFQLSPNIIKYTLYLFF